MGGENIPLFLYKYQALDELHRERVQRIFTHNEIYFASPQEFKDPFDSKVIAPFVSPNEDWNHYLHEMLEKRHPEWSEEGRKSAVKQLLRVGWHEDVGVQQHIIRDVQEMIDTVGIYCLSEVPDDIIMWNSYANFHKGFCLKFHINPQRHPFGRYLHKVLYTSTYPEVSLTQNREELGKKILLTKSTRWSHEKEWRILDFERGKGPRVFPPDMLVGLIFGCEMSHEEKQLFRQWVKGREQSFRFYQALKREKEFGIDIVETLG